MIFFREVRLDSRKEFFCFLEQENTDPFFYMKDESWIGMYVTILNPKFVGWNRNRQCVVSVKLPMIPKFKNCSPGVWLESLDTVPSCGVLQVSRIFLSS